MVLAADAYDNLIRTNSDGAIDHVTYKRSEWHHLIFAFKYKNRWTS